jgi:hypothetical protein
MKGIGGILHSCQYPALPYRGGAPWATDMGDMEYFVFYTCVHFRVDIPL